MLELLVIGGNLAIFAAVLGFASVVRTQAYSGRIRQVDGQELQEWYEKDRANASVGSRKLVGAISELSTAEIIDDCLEVRVGGYEPVRFVIGKSQNFCKAFTRGPTSELSYHGFEMQRHFIAKFDETGDSRLVDDFWRAWNEWDGRRLTKAFGSLPWYDHCVAHRIVIARYATFVLLKRDCLSLDQYRILLEFTFRQGRYLASNRCYDANTNHGLIVDACLISAAESLPDGTERNTWMERALSRSLGRIDHFVSDDGVPLEGSCSYWRLIYDLLCQIRTVAVRAGCRVPSNAEAKLLMARDLLIDTNIQGRIHRLGDTSGDHTCAPPGERSPTADGYYLHVLDSGLVYFNGIREGVVLTQFMFNVQDNPPYVHRHEDTLSFNLFHDDVFWIESPGSYSVGYGAKVMAVKGRDNQSIVFDPISGYRETSRVTRCDWDARSFAVTAVTPREGPPLIERTIRFNLDTEELVIDDRHCSGGSVISQYLLDPRAAVRLDKAIGATLERQAKRLTLFTSAPIEIVEGWISYARNQLEKTAMLRVLGIRTEVRIPIAVGLRKLSVYRTPHQYPYAKRRTTVTAWEHRLATRLHVRRLQQLALLLAVECVVIVAVAKALSLA